MSFSIPNGATLSIATALAASINVSAATNASECVLTTATNTYAVGDIVEFTSGWSKANNRVFRVKAAGSTSVTLEGFDTSNTTLFPAGSGVGSVRKVTAWQQITQVIDAPTSGGDVQTNTIQFLEDDDEQEYATVSSAASFDVTLADDVASLGYLALKSISDVRGQAPFSIALPSGAKNYYKVAVFLNENPNIAKNEVVTVKARLSLRSKVVRYAS